MNRYCPAMRCPKRIKPQYAFCPAHWNVIPSENQRAIWKAYLAKDVPLNTKLVADAVELIDKREKTLHGVK